MVGLSGEGDLSANTCPIVATPHQNTCNTREFLIGRFEIRSSTTRYRPHSAPKREKLLTVPGGETQPELFYAPAQLRPLHKYHPTSCLS